MKGIYLCYTTIVIILTAAIVIWIRDTQKIQLQASEIAEMNEKVEVLNKQISDLNGEKDDLESKLSDLTKKQIQFYKPNITDPNFQQNSSLPNNINEQNVSGNGIAVVVYKHSPCDYFILENASGFIVAEWMGGNDPDLGDKVTGDFSSFGTKDFYNQTLETDSRLWIDDYMLSKEDALDKIKEQCE